VAGEARQQVIQLSQLNLEAAFARSRARRKNVQNELGAVDDLGVDGLFEVALLGGREVVVEDHHVGAAGCDGGRDLIDFAMADEGGGVRSRARLKQSFGDLGPGAGGQFGQLFEDSSIGTALSRRRASRVFHSSPTRIARSRTGLRGGVI